MISQKLQNKWKVIDSFATKYNNCENCHITVEKGYMYVVQNQQTAAIPMNVCVRCKSILVEN
ncbi:hypothetical protein [endosymbiont DhMRE of Dentiscutata heterogama]|uniref:hypothetical protein n=1 Tax=endosymbiont DhMRE of Dentiscutata heterogama TaxID=1609546 RepID=UPI002AD53215|nr:hypothetical protein [endosymbiont DhMRE of Dentiscutata heterogama]